MKGLVILAMLLGGAQKDVPPKGSQQQKHSQPESSKTQPSAPPPTTSEVDKENAANAERYAYYKAHPKEYFKAAIAPAYFSNWVLAGLGVVGGFVAVFTLLAIKRQTDLMVDKERARITVEIVPANLELEDGPEWTEEMRVVYAGAKITVSNLGATNAFNVTSSAKILSTPDRGTLESPETMMLLLPSVIGPSIQPVVVDVSTLLKGVDRVIKVRSKEEVLHLVGTIAYNDIFGNKYKTVFRYLWRVENLLGDDPKFDISRWEKTSKGNKAT